MKFSDKKERDMFDLVIVRRTCAEMEAREEYNSLLWEEIGYAGKCHSWYKTPVRDVKVGENIYGNVPNFNKPIAYRVD